MNNTSLSKTTDQLNNKYSPSLNTKQKDTNTVPYTEQLKPGTAYLNISKKSQKPPHSRKPTKNTSNRPSNLKPMTPD